DFVLSEFRVAAAALHRPVADFASKYAWITEAIDGKDETGWAIGPQVGRSHTAFFESRTPVDGDELTFVLEHRSPHPRHLLGRFRLSAWTVPDPTEALALPASIRELLSDAGTEGDPRIAAHYRTIAPALREVRERIARKRKELEALNIPTALVFRERSGESRPSTRVRIRGNFLLPGEEVAAG